MCYLDPVGGTKAAVALAVVCREAFVPPAGWEEHWASCTRVSVSQT